jgi:hypothetical protein
MRELLEKGRVVETTTFSSSCALAYALVISDDEKTPKAQFIEDKIIIDLPREIATRWADSDQVGIEHVQEIAGEAPLKILVEKDFECTNPPPGESQDDAYPNPGKCA